MDFFDSLEKLSNNIDRLSQTTLQAPLQPDLVKADPSESFVPQHTALMNELVSNTKNLESQALELKRLADSSEHRAILAEEDSKRASAAAKTARRDSLFSKIISIISVLISIGSLTVAIVALVLS